MGFCREQNLKKSVFFKDENLCVSNTKAKTGSHYHRDNLFYSDSSSANSHCLPRAVNEGNHRELLWLDHDLQPSTIYCWS